MRFRSSNLPDDPGFVRVNGVYFHGKVAESIKYDCAEIAKQDAEPFRLLVNESAGIEGMKVEVEGYPGKTVLYAWKSFMGVPMVANPSVEMFMFRGLIVDADDSEALEYAKECFKERKQSL